MELPLALPLRPRRVAGAAGQLRAARQAPALLPQAVLDLADTLAAEPTHANRQALLAALLFWGSWLRVPARAAEYPHLSHLPESAWHVPQREGEC